jgi:hypothetical protein
VSAGIFSHIAYFNRGEHHLQGTFYLKLFLTAILIGTAILHHTQDVPWTLALDILYKHALTYLLGVYASLLSYRVFLHPLRNFPGPFFARVSSIWISTQLKNNNRHIKLLELHQKYGSIVRIGSSDLSICRPSAIEEIYGPKSRCVKGMSYDLTHPNPSLHQMRDAKKHHSRRRIWSGAFSDKLLRGYQQRIRGYQEQLAHQISKSIDNEQCINVKKLFSSVCATAIIEKFESSICLDMLQARLTALADL